MPAPAATMETAHGMTEAPPRVEEKPEWWASPATLGLMGFGLTTMLAGLTVGQWIPGGALLSSAIFFGGLCQLFAGLIALRKGNMFGGTAFTGYGAFWLAFWYLNTQIPVGATNGYDAAAFDFIWFMFTLAFVLNVWKHGWGLTAVFVTLLVAFLLLLYLNWEAASGNLPAKSTFQGVGAEIILTGLLAWIVATADLTNWNMGRRVIPV
jgi:uncharacterized protein